MIVVTEGSMQEGFSHQEIRFNGSRLALRSTKDKNYSEYGHLIYLKTELEPTEIWPSTNDNDSSSRHVSHTCCD